MLFRKIGEDVFVHERATIKYPELVEIGNHVVIDNEVIVSTGLILGDYIHIAPQVCFIGGKTTKTIMKDFSFIAAGTKVISGSEDYINGLVGPTIPAKYKVLKLSDVIFEKYTGCGVNCSIMPGVTLAEGSILGANSFLTKSTEPWKIYGGSPAKLLGNLTRNKDAVLNAAKDLGYEI